MSDTEAAAYRARMRAMAPATICMVTPTSQPAITIDVKARCGSARINITPTETKAASAARKVPTALSNSAASNFPPECGGLLVRLLKWQLGRVDSEVEPDRADEHHDEQKALRGQRGDAGADMGSDKQAGGGTGHRKPGAFQHMGKFSDAESHRRNPRSAAASG